MKYFNYAVMTLLIILSLYILKTSVIDALIFYHGYWNKISEVMENIFNCFIPILILFYLVKLESHARKNND